jgi:outer membrane biosynthesis protein TonB
MALIGRPEERNIELSGTDTRLSEESKESGYVPSAQSSPFPEVHFSIYENSSYLGESVFAKEQISIGSSPHADVVLYHQSVADIHAFVGFKEGQAFLSNKYPNNGLSLNGRSIKSSKLKHKDVIEIGPFSLKTKLEDARIIKRANRDERKEEHRSDAVPETPFSGTIFEDARYSLTLINEYDSDESRRDAAVRLAKILGSDAEKIEILLKRPKGLVKKDLDAKAAGRWQSVLEKAGLFYELQLTDIEQYAVPLDRYKITKHHEDHLVPETGFVLDRRKPAPTRQPGFLSIPQDMDDEDEDEIWEAPFLLRQKLSDSPDEKQTPHGARIQLMVVKTIGDSVADVSFLSNGQKYAIHTEKGRFRLAEYKGENRAYVYFTSDFDGHVSPQPNKSNDLDVYKTNEYLYRKRKELYRIPFPKKGVITIADERCEYQISQTLVLPSPNITVPETPSTFTWRHWFSSLGSHMVVLLCLLIYGYFHAPIPEREEPIFAKVDPELIKQLELKKTPEVKKKEPTPEPKPKPAARKVAPVKKTPPKEIPKTTPKKTQKKKKPKKSVAGQSPSKDPNAGGGFGEGNIKNRNINQTGILSVLGGKTPGGNAATVVAVTNLDAVAVPGATEKNFSVGGVKGSLGDGKIVVARGEMIQTKGGEQILRSAGADGDGQVAALEKGTTGKKKVQAMVTAKLNRTVRVEGGMSREMVKRVIDQHLSEITFCYESALISNPNIMGRISFEWKILMSGQVGEVRILASSINSHDVHDCIISAIKSWQFPKPVGTEVVVSYPFVFDLVAF